MSAQAQDRENPRTRRVRHVILDAGAHLLVEHGAGEVTANRIAQETGVARTTIYRHWPDQSDLLLATIDSLVAPHSPSSSSGDLEADLVAALSDLRARMIKRPFRQVFAALLSLANQDQAFVAAQQRFVNGVLQPLEDALAAAVTRGDLHSSVDIPSACAVLAGPLFHQHVMLRAGIDNQLITDAVDRFLSLDGAARST